MCSSCSDGCSTAMPCGLATSSRLFLLIRVRLLVLMPADQIQQREEIDPNNIDEVPVEAEVLDHRMVAGGIEALPCISQQEEHDAHTDNHVYGVHAGHGKVQAKVDLCFLSQIVVQRLFAMHCRMFKFAGVEGTAHEAARNVMVVPFGFVFHGLDA